VPDELTGRPPRSAAGAAEAPPAPPPASTPPAPPPVSSAPAAGSEWPPRRPSWLCALLVSLVIVAAGAALGAAGYRVERSHWVRTPTVERTSDGWRLTSRGGHELSGLGLDGPHLIWQDGASIEFLDLEKGQVLLLGPGPGLHATWDPAVGERYAIWFEAERQASLAAQAIAYDIETGRRWTLGDIGSVYSYPAISGDLAVWCSAKAIGRQAIHGVRIGGGEWLEVAAQYGAPVVSGGLVVWAESWTGPFTAKEIASGTSWPVAAGLSHGKLTGLALADRTLVWGQSSETAGSGAVTAADVDGGETTTVAAGLTGLVGPACDERTVVWGESTASGGRVMGRRLGGGPSFVVAEVDGDVVEVAVSGDTVAWIESSGGATDAIVTMRLPR
jgi:hypothetical protein